MQLMFKSFSFPTPCVSKKSYMHYIHCISYKVTYLQGMHEVKQGHRGIRGDWVRHGQLVYALLLSEFCGVFQAGHM